MGDSKATTASMLIVGTAAELQHTLTPLLTELGYGVHLAASAQQAIEAISEQAPDLILLGTGLPDTDGLDLCRRLRASEPTRETPVLLVQIASGSVDPGPWFAAGCDDRMTAPFQPNEVRTRLEHHLALGALRRELAETRSRLEQEMSARRRLDDALLHAQHSGLSLAENLNEVIYAVDDQGVVAYVSPTIERLLGYAPAEVENHPVDAFFHPDDLARLRERIQDVLSGRETSNEYRAIAKSGEIRWVRTSSQPILQDDRVSGAHGVLTDISASRQAEEQIREQNEFLTSILESLTHPFYVIDTADRSILMANSAARSLGWSGTGTCYALTHGLSQPCDAADHPCPLEKVRTTRKPVMVEHTHYDAEGNERHIEVHSYPLFDAGGDVSRVIEYALDVTERRKAEDALRESEQRWRSLTETSPDHIVMLDADLRIQFANFASPGLTVDDLIGTPLYTWVDEARQAEIKAILENALRTGMPSRYETVYHLPDGGKLYYESFVAARTSGGSGPLVGLTVSARDITERRRAEDALQRSQALLQETQRLAQVGGWELDLESSKATWTEEVYRIHELPTDFEPTLDSALAFYHPDDRPVLEQAVARAEETGEPWDLELRFITATGRELWVRAIGNAELQEGKVVRLSGTFQDVTKSKQAEQALQEAAVSEERTRLARDLHDSVTQALFSASLVAEVLPQVWQRDPSAAQEGLAELRLLTRGALAEMRTMLLELRPSTLTVTALNVLLSQLTEAVTSRTRLDATVEVEPIAALPPEVHITFYRVAQEALHNVVKHAGASHVTVRLAASPPRTSPETRDSHGQVNLEIVDDGMGFEAIAAQPSHMGLGIMRERAESVGAVLTIESRSGRGTRARLVWPRD